MSRATPQTRELAERLVASEARGKKTSELKTPAAFFVCEKLRPYLATLMGSTGFHALLSRALAVANADDAWLRTVHVKADGSLGGFDRPNVPVNLEVRTEGSVVLVTQLLGLLVAFIGENLTLRMVKELWPKLPLTDVHFDQGDKI
jgi:hypothetical protein